MRRIIAATVAALAVVALGAGSAVAEPSPKSTAEITFALNTATCELTIHSTKDISFIDVDGVKDEDVNATSVTIQVAEGDVVTVKSGTTTATFTVTGCVGDHVPPDDPHDPEDPHDPHDGHTGPDHDGDGDHDADDHH